MTEYIIRVAGEIRCSTSWRPMAIAAWNRATCDWNGAISGGEVELLVDGEVIECAQAKSGKVIPWPVRGDVEPDIRDVAAAVLQLCRAAGVSAGDLADAMTRDGLPTTRSRLKSISTIEGGRQSGAGAAEIVAMCYSAITAIKQPSAE